MKKEMIMQQGMGCGEGEVIEAIARVEIEKIINDTSFSQCVVDAHEERNNIEDGMTCVDLTTGKVFSFSMQSNNSNQACDNNYIILACVLSNEDDYFDPDNEQIEEYIEAYDYDEDFPGLREGWDNFEWNSDRAKNINEKKWNEQFEHLRELNKDHFEPYENEFDWNSINDDLDAFYDYE